MPLRPSLLWLSLLGAVACAKDEPPAPASATHDADASPLAPAARDAEAADATPRPPAAPTKIASPLDAGACGEKPHPDCPLQHWMKANTGAAIVRKDLPALASALDTLATFAPDGYPYWVSIAKDGAAAARAEKLDAVKAACRGCHESYRKKYKAEDRTRPIPDAVRP